MAVINGGEGDSVLTGTDGDDVITDALTGDDTLRGGGGDDVLEGGIGDDIISGGTGVDTFNVFRDTMGADQVNLGEDSDVVNVTGGAGQVRLTFVGALVGNGTHREAGADGGVAVRFQNEDAAGGLTGSQARYDDEGVTFSADTGITFDIRDLATGHLHGDHFQVVSLGTSSADTLFASEQAKPHFLDGGDGNDTLIGGSAADFLAGGEGDDALEAGDGDDRIRAGLGEDTLLAGAGNDTLNGGRGADRHLGGQGDDTFVIDNVGDDIVEAAGAGTDTVRSSISWTLAADLENLSLISGRQVNATGNGLDNVIYGNDRGNVITGRAGADVITGLGGADRFVYDSVSESTLAAYDVIRDLGDGDVIDLSGIDASTMASSDQAFLLVAAFSGAAGQLRLQYDAARNVTWVLGDVDGDSRADFWLGLLGNHTDYDDFRL